MKRNITKLAKQLSEMIQPEIDAASATDGVLIVLASELPEPRIDALDAFGITSTVFGSFFGHVGPCMILNDELALKFHHGVESDAVDLLTAISIHETSHFLTRGARLFEQMNVPGVTLSPEHLVHLINNQDTSRDRSESSPTELHTLDWARGVFHLAYRANVRGIYCSLSRIANWDAAGFVSGPWRYQGALGDELEQFASRSIGDVLREPMPSEFLDMWKKDRLHVAVDRVGKA